MQKGVLIELVLQRVSGGIVNQDTSRQVRREDIEAYLPASINYAITKQYYINKREDGESTIPNDFISTYYVDVQYDQRRDIYYSMLPTQLISMDKNRGLRSISPIKGDDQFIEARFEARKHDSYYSGSTAQSTIYRLIGDRVDYDNISPSVTEVVIRMVSSIGSLNDEDEVPLPSGTEVEVIQICSEFFLGQRSAQPDFINNNTSL